MASKESAVSNSIMLKLSKAGFRVFRNNIGSAWMATGKPINTGNGDMLLKNARAVAFGVGGKGGSDLIGWHTVEVTEDMVGKKIAIFAAIEVKAPGGAVRPEQVNFVNQVNAAGGKAMICDDENNMDGFIYD